MSYEEEEEGEEDEGEEEEDTPGQEKAFRFRSASLFALAASLQR